MTKDESPCIALDCPKKDLNKADCADDCEALRRWQQGQPYNRCTVSGPLKDPSELELRTEKKVPKKKLKATKVKKSGVVKLNKDKIKDCYAHIDVTITDNPVIGLELPPYRIGAIELCQSKVHKDDILDEGTLRVSFVDDGYEIETFGFLLGVNEPRTLGRTLGAIIEHNKKFKV